MLDRPFIFLARALVAMFIYLTGWGLAAFVTVALLVDAAGCLWHSAALWHDQRPSDMLVYLVWSVADVFLIGRARRIAERSEQPAGSTATLPIPAWGLPMLRGFTWVTVVITMISPWRFGKPWYWMTQGALIAAWALIAGPPPGRTLPADIRRLTARARRPVLRPAISERASTVTGTP